MFPNNGSGNAYLNCKNGSFLYQNYFIIMIDFSYTFCVFFLFVEERNKEIFEKCGKPKNVRIF